MKSENKKNRPKQLAKFVRRTPVIKGAREGRPVLPTGIKKAEEDSSMFTPLIWRATAVALFATVMVMPGVGLADELGPRPSSAEQDGRVPRERVRQGQPERPGQDSVSRSEVRRCIQAVKEHGGDRDDLRRCLKEAHKDELTRPEVRRCIEEVREHGGDRSDLRRCLAKAHDDHEGGNPPAPVSTAPGPSLLNRAP
jgi:hypothetical protein